MSTLKTLLGSASAVILGALATAITVTNGSVTFDATDKTAMNSAVSNSISNLWAGFEFVLPYIGIAVGIIFVIVMGKKLTKGR